MTEFARYGGAAPTVGDLVVRSATGRITDVGPESIGVTWDNGCKGVFRPNRTGSFEAVQEPAGSAGRADSLVGALRDLGLLPDAVTSHP